MELMENEWKIMEISQKITKTRLLVTTGLLLLGRLPVFICKRLNKNNPVLRCNL